MKMRAYSVLLASVLATPTVSAQDGRIVRHPLLAPLATTHAPCHTRRIQPDLRRRGLDTLRTIVDTATRRTVSIGSRLGGAGTILIVAMNDSAKRSTQGANVTVTFSSDGRVTAGARVSVAREQPASQTRGWRAALSETDTAQALLLKDEVLKACSG